MKIFYLKKSSVSSIGLPRHLRGLKTRIFTEELSSYRVSLVASFDRAPPLDLFIARQSSGFCSRYYRTDQGIKVLLGFTYLLSFIFNNSQLLLFPAHIRVWYCLVGHDSHLAVCCSVDTNYPTTGYLPATGIA